MNTIAAMTFLNKGALALATMLLILAALWDARYYRIPNAISFALLVLFPAYVLTSPRPVVWGQHLFIAALVLALGFLLYTRKFIGAGDAKLLGAASLWAGPERIGILLLIIGVTGGVLSLVTATLVYMRRRKTKGQKRESLAKTPVPYGVAIATGGLCVLIAMFNPPLF